MWLRVSADMLWSKPSLGCGDVCHISNTAHAGGGGSIACTCGVMVASGSG